MVRRCFVVSKLALANILNSTDARPKTRHCALVALVVYTKLKLSGFAVIANVLVSFLFCAVKTI